jgi:hypothetical protein
VVYQNKALEVIAKYSANFIENSCGKEKGLPLYVLIQLRERIKELYKKDREVFVPQLKDFFENYSNKKN